MCVLLSEQHKCFWRFYIINSCFLAALALGLDFWPLLLLTIHSFVFFLHRVLQLVQKRTSVTYYVVLSVPTVKTNRILRFSPRFLKTVCFWWVRDDGFKTVLLIPFWRAKQDLTGRELSADSITNLGYVLYGISISCHCLSHRSICWHQRLSAFLTLATSNLLGRKVT